MTDVPLYTVVESIEKAIGYTERRLKDLRRFIADCEIRVNGYNKEIDFLEILKSNKMEEITTFGAEMIKKQGTLESLSSELEKYKDALNDQED